MNEFGTTSNYLHKRLTALNLQFYKGIYPGDRIPHLSKLRYIFCIKVNIDPISKPGRHWIAILRFKTQTKIFDSANLSIRKYHPQTIKILKKLKAKPIRKYPLQTAYSFAYGNYCLHAILKFHMLINNIALNNKPFLLFPSEKMTLFVHLM